MVKVGIVNKSNNELPKYATIGSSGIGSVPRRNVFQTDWLLIALQR